MWNTLLSATNGDLDVVNTYGFIILLSLVIILSYGFNLLAAKTRIPSVLMLIILGVVLQFLAKGAHITLPDLRFSLEVLGQVGLIMIVLEAALELEIKRDKLKLIGKSFGAATVGLIFSVAGIAVVVYYIGNASNSFEPMSWLSALLEATCLAVISSAIVIPSVGILGGDKKEWMIYEATFSDILGIMLFYFLLTLEATPLREASFSFLGSFLLTLVASVVISYVLVILFQRVKTHIKLFLLIAVLMLLYFVGKVFHLSPLWVILIFGLVLANDRLFFRGFLKGLVDHTKVREIDRDFTILTMEFAFLIRTFFFVVFGFTLDLPTLLVPVAWLESIAIVAIIYLVRYMSLRMFRWKGDLAPELWIAPRGLITILLFYGIPASLIVPDIMFSPGILLIVILLTSFIMTWGMIRSGGEAPPTDLMEIRMEGLLPLNNPPVPPAPLAPASLDASAGVSSQDHSAGAAASTSTSHPPVGEGPVNPLTASIPPPADSASAEGDSDQAADDGDTTAPDKT